MKNTLQKALGLFSFSLLTLSGFSQHNCATHPTPEQIQYLNETRSARQNYQYSHLRATINYPIQFHVVRRSDGTGGLSASTVAGLLTELNDHYINANLQFFECSSINYIDSDTYYSLETSEESAMGAAHDVNNVINIYLVDYAGGYCGWTRLPPSTIDRIILKNSCATNGSTNVHEMGHYFSLYHTHGKTNTGTTDEMVDGSNCSSAGDDVCDTPADPNLSGNVNSSCVYTGTSTDANGDAYTPNPNNMMSYSLKACRNFLSAGQYSRVAYSAANDRTYLSCTVTPPTCASVSSFPYNEGFESGLGSWTNTGGDDFDWTRKTGATTSSNTGPTSASEGSYYMYTEASSPNYPSKTTDFYSPCFDFSSLSSPLLSFSYHMYGATMGSLTIQASTDNGASWSSSLWTRSGDQGNSWNTASVNLSAYSGQASVKLRFRGVTGSSYTGDIAIDDVGVSGTASISYCTANGTNQSYEYIQQVSFGSSSNNSGNNSGYLDATSTTFNLTSSTAITLTPGYSGSSYNEYWKVYIDANGDGDFADAGEEVFSGSGTGAVSGTLSPPTGMVSPTRMRVVMNYSSTISSCGSFTYGEVEDYTVTASSADAEESFETFIQQQTAGIQDVTAYPNPVQGMLNVDFESAQATSLTIRILDPLGRTMLLKTIEAHSGNNHQLLNLSSFASGYYFLQITGNEVTHTQKIIVSP